VAGAQPCATITVEVFKEIDVVAPVRIVLELLGSAIDGAPAMVVAPKDPV